MSSIIILFLSSGILLSQSIETNEIKNIHFLKGEKELSVFIEFTESLTYESFTLFSPNRLIIDFFNVQTILTPGPFEVNAFGVTNIRTGKPNPQTSRIVFDFDEEIPRYNISDTEAGIKISFWREEAKVEEIPTPEKKEPKQPAEKPVKKEKKAPRDISETKKMAVGVNGGLYFMADEVFNEVYGKSLFGFGGEYFFLLPISQEHGVDFWMAFNYLTANGQTTYLEEDVKLKMSHTSFAARYVHHINRVSLFIGPGLDYIFYQETYPEGFPVSSVEGSALGFHIQAGAYIDIMDSIAGKAFIKYNLAKTTQDDFEVKLGGLHLGIGLIFRFNI